jgi:4-diphosphocytidyl-2-C-methyl-D-erythritol kinase
MVSFPPCKINLGLNVIRKRTDGYHDIATCFYPVPWTDALEIVPSKNFTFSTSGDQVPGAVADNLCVRAYELLKKDFPLKPVNVHLLKKIPIGAGLGGGSADGAYTLKMLNDLFELSLTKDRLIDYAAMLGSDCPFFIESKPVIGSGRGEILSPANLSLKGKYLIVVKPEVSISTRQAFSETIPREPGVDIRTIIENHPPADWKLFLKNDFEESTFKRFPIIQVIHTKLYAFGATYASMSGSGSAVFGLFEQEVDLRNEFQSLTYWSGYLD